MGLSFPAGSNVLLKRLRVQSKRKMLLLEALPLLLLLAHGAGAEDLFPFTSLQSNPQLSRGDEEASNVSLTTPFVFFGYEYSSINVS